MLPRGKEESDARLIREEAHPIVDERDEDLIVAEIGGGSLVLLGEASHGTHDFYALRARITRKLIERHGFSAVAIEGDWPDAYEVNRYVRGDRDAADARDALRGFERFPTWMWRNTAVADFVSWLREHNQAMDNPERSAGFYGLDLYSLHASMRAVVAYLENHDPAAAKAAQASYGCFEDFGHDTDHYAWAVSRLGEGSCEDAVARELVSLREKRAEFLRQDGPAAADEYFYAVQNARLARNAERYYRTMFQGRVASWNLRDEHMAGTLEELLTHLASRGQAPKVVVWAHNSHLGDARATELGQSGELNLGQLVRQKHGAAAKLVGFTTDHGTVVAASAWDEPGRVRRVRPGLDGSYEKLFHLSGVPRFYLSLRAGARVRAVLATPRLERAIGVIYRPETERQSHYFEANLAEQFDLVIHLDETRAVQPLEHELAWDPTETPETYPSGV